MSKYTENLIEIDCNSDEWSSVTSDLRNGWSLENEIRFAFKTKDEECDGSIIEDEFYDKFETLDTIVVEEVEFDEAEEGYKYYGVSIIVYKSGIGKEE